MLLQPLFWPYLLSQFLLFVHFTNLVTFRPRHPRRGMGGTGWEYYWFAFSAAVQGVPSVLLIRDWDFTLASYGELPPFLAFYAAASVLGAAGLLADHLWWKAFGSRPVAYRLLRRERVRVPRSLEAPFRFLGSVGIENQVYRLETNEYEVRLPGWPPEFSGLSLVQLTDLHIGKYIRRDYLRAAVRAACMLKPDLFCLTGDFISVKRHIPGLRGLFRDLKAPLGVYGLMGNHDYWIDGEAVRKILEGDGVRVLRNETVLFERRGRTLALMGTDDLWMGEKDEAPILGARADAKILLAHNPDHFYLAKKAGAHLQLSGHCHGGQIRFPFIGPLIVPSLHGRRYASGFLRERDSVLFISRGIGGYPPIRTLCPPEVVKLTLRPLEG